MKIMSADLTKYDEEIRKLKNRDWIAGLLAIGACVIAIGSLFDGINKIHNYFIDPELNKQRRELLLAIDVAETILSSYQVAGDAILEKNKKILEWDPSDSYIERLNLAVELLNDLEVHKEMINLTNEKSLKEVRARVEKALTDANAEIQAGTFANGFENKSFKDKLSVHEAKITKAHEDWSQLHNATVIYLREARKIGSGNRVPLEDFKAMYAQFVGWFFTRIADSDKPPELFGHIRSKVHPTCLALLKRM